LRSMGGSSSKEKSGAARAPKGGKNAYTYAKKLGISRTKLSVEGGAADSVWNDFDKKGLGYVDSKNVGPLLKEAAGKLLETLLDNQLPSIQSAKAKLGKNFQPTIDKLTAYLAHQLEDQKSTEMFLKGLGDGNKLARDNFIKCMAAGVKINKDGTLNWTYLSEVGVGSGAVSGAAAEEEQNANLAPPKRESASPRGMHQKKFSVRQLRVLSKGIYSASSGNLEKELKSKDKVKKKRKKESGEKKSQPVLEAKSPIEKAKKEEKKAAAPEEGGSEGGETREKKSLSGNQWHSKKMKAMNKFATLRGDGPGEKAKKKKKKKHKKRASKGEGENIS